MAFVFAFVIFILSAQGVRAGCSGTYLCGSWGGTYECSITHTNCNVTRTCDSGQGSCEWVSNSNCIPRDGSTVYNCSGSNNNSCTNPGTPAGCECVAEKTCSYSGASPTPTTGPASCDTACGSWSDGGGLTCCAVGKQQEVRACPADRTECSVERCTKNNSSCSCTTPSAPTGLSPNSNPACTVTQRTFSWNAPTNATASAYNLRIDEVNSDGTSGWNGKCGTGANAPNPGDTCKDNHPVREDLRSFRNL